MFGNSGITYGKLFIQVTLSLGLNRLALKQLSSPEEAGCFINLAWMENATSKLNIDYHEIGFPKGKFEDWWVNQDNGAVNLFIVASDIMILDFVRCRSRVDEGVVVNLTVNEWLQEIDSLPGLDETEKLRVRGIATPFMETLQ